MTSARIRSWITAWAIFFWAWTLIGSNVWAAESEAETEPALKPNLPSIFIVGDSTAAHGDAEHTGWGMLFPAYFNLDKVNVANRARAGRSSKTYMAEGLWDHVLAEMKPGDVVLLQFGHNDGGSVDKEKARGSLPGIGEETREVTLPDGKPATVHTFGWYTRKYIADTKAKGATAVVIAPTIRNIWHEGRVEPGLGHYTEWAASVAKQEGVDFIDLTARSVAVYEKMGEEKMKENFPKDHTHTNAAGAQINAELILAEWKRIPNERLWRWLSAKGRQLVASVVEESNLREPALPAQSSLFLVGDATLRNGRGDGANHQWGWGEPLAAFFDSTQCNVVNRAMDGTSSRTYLTDGWWDQTLALIKSGDYVLLEFGLNDGAELNDAARARGTIRGVGDETQEIDNLHTKRHEVVHTFGWYLRDYVADIRAKGAKPILCSMVPRDRWQKSRVVRDEHADWTAEVAKTLNVPFVDLNAIVSRTYEQRGADQVASLFASDRVHTTLEGAQLNAEVCVSALKAMPELHLDAFWSARASTISAR